MQGRCAGTAAKLIPLWPKSPRGYLGALPAESATAEPLAESFPGDAPGVNLEGENDLLCFRLVGQQLSFRSVSTFTRVAGSILQSDRIVGNTLVTRATIGISCTRRNIYCVAILRKLGV